MNKPFIINNRSVVVSLIAAVAENRVIGKNNKLLWHIPEDFKFFKAKTMGKPMIMGRKTFESLPGILPGRPHIVISHNPPEDAPDSVHYVTSMEAALDMAFNMAREVQEGEIFIIGGAQIYEAALETKMVNKIYRTLVHGDYVGDTYFPALDSKWRVVEEKRIEGDPSFTFQTLLL